MGRITGQITKKQDTNYNQDTIEAITKSIFKSQAEMQKKFDLEERTTEFAKAVVRLCRFLKPDCVNQRIISQIVASSGSVGANYREANDCLGEKDFIYRLKIARKEAKESIHWLEILNEANKDTSGEISELIREATELKKILSAIIIKSS